jgi:hypothetical protein
MGGSECCKSTEGVQVLLNAEFDHSAGLLLSTLASAEKRAVEMARDLERLPSMRRSDYL